MVCQTFTFLAVKVNLVYFEENMLRKILIIALIELLFAVCTLVNLDKIFLLPDIYHTRPHGMRFP